MKLLTQALTRLPEFNRLCEAIEGGLSPVSVTGLAAVHRAHMAAGLGMVTGRPVVVICSDEGEAERIARDITSFTEEQVPVLKARTMTFYPGATVSKQWEHRRLSIMHQIRTGKVRYMTASIEGMLQRTMPPDVLDRCSWEFRIGESWNLEEVCRDLVTAGYSRCDQVEGVGQFAARGGILDVFPPGMEFPVRLDFFGDEIDAMGIFDTETQRRISNIESALILPAGEVLPHAAPGGLDGLTEAVRKLLARAEKAKNQDLAKTLARDLESAAQLETIPAPDRYMPLIYPKMATAAEFLPPDACVIISESVRVAERAKNWQWQTEEDVKLLLEKGELDGSCSELGRTYSDFSAELENWGLVYLDAFAASGYPIPPRVLLPVTAKQLPGIGASPEAAVQDLLHYQKNRFSSLVLASGEQHARELQEHLQEQGIRSALMFNLTKLPDPGETYVTTGGLSGGIEYPTIRLAVITEGERTQKHRRRSKGEDESNRQKVKSYADLSPGDLVIHEHHGLGRYVGMVKMQVDGIQKDYVKLAYAGSDVLYVPATSLDLISKYIGGGEDGNSRRKLNSLGGRDWEKTKTKARKAVQNLAKGLVKLYAERERQPGYAFGPDTEWQKEFEDEFEFTETEDQLRSAMEIKRDMEKPRPMDRLLCGDVGYGKTEVAFRAVMKCVMEGKQACILVPTTVLARQHYLTAIRRFQNYPVSIDVLSRFRTPAQVRDTLARVKAGKVDLLIGTHRLFNQDVQFADLGLLVVDEEQRFGVRHKEKLKNRFKQVDVLTLSATPIPRTLNMALSGIRDMSTLEEPPQDRLPVQTYVLEHDWSVLADAMRKELGRGGQVFYLHNRVETIESCAARIRALLGEDVTVGIAHGQMDQEQIDDVMTQMTDNEISVLVCTTIIETGIDLPNVNTLIIEDADRMGLAQLHQIRGRVGRSARRAYAYLTYRPGKALSESAEKRLAAIRDFAEFGSGFKIAMRDLEIRGAGNVLGPEQSGFMLSVGYDMYLKMLEEAVLTEQGLTPTKEAECSASLTIPASVPDRYVPSSEQRMDLYRRIAALRTEEDANDLVDELIDRYGDPPRPVNNLIAVALLRAEAARAGITDIDQRNGNLLIKSSQFNMDRVNELCREPKYRGHLLYAGGDKPYLSLRLDRKQDSLRMAQSLIHDYAGGPERPH